MRAPSRVQQQQKPEIAANTTNGSADAHGRLEIVYNTLRWCWDDVIFTVQMLCNFPTACGWSAMMVALPHYGDLDMICQVSAMECQVCRSSPSTVVAGRSPLDFLLLLEPRNATRFLLIHRFLLFGEVS